MRRKKKTCLKWKNSIKLQKKNEIKAEISNIPDKE